MIISMKAKATSIASLSTIALLTSAFLFIFTVPSTAELRPVFVTSTGNFTIQLNESVTIGLSGEGSERVTAYSTGTPSICSVSAEGVVTGVNGGTCSILASISGSNSYPDTTPAVLILEVSDPAPGGSKKVLTVDRLNGRFSINLDFQPDMAKKRVQLQIGIKNSSGQINFKSISTLLLNDKGRGSVQRQATYAKGIYFRALVNKKIIVTKKVA